MFGTFWIGHGGFSNRRDETCRHRPPRPLAPPHFTRAPLVVAAARFGTRERSRTPALVPPALAQRPSPGPRRVARFVALP